MGPKPQPVADRLRSSIRIDEATGCWLWQKAILKNCGYALIKMSGGKMRRAHRVSYETFVGPIPAAKQCLHSCDVRHCINPEHLWLGTHLDNMADMARKGRAAKGADNHFGRVKFEGAANFKSKLTVEAVKEIRAGMSTRDAMAKFSVTQATVCKARSGFGWRHVT